MVWYAKMILFLSYFCFTLGSSYIGYYSGLLIRLGKFDSCRPRKKIKNIFTFLKMC